MRVVVVYWSKFGNTKRVAEAMAGALAAANGGNGTAQAIPAGTFVPSDLQDADLVLLGSPTHKGSVPQELRPLLEALPRGCLQGTRVAAFDTSYRMNRFLAYFTAAKRLDAILRRLGGKRIARPETFVVAGREGPMEDGEIQRAASWAAALGASAMEARTA